MLLIQNRPFTALPQGRDSRLTYRRLRRPTRLPTIAAEAPWGRWLSWLGRLVAR